MAIASFSCCAKNLDISPSELIDMLDEFYRIPDTAEDWRMLRSEGYLGAAQIQRPDGQWMLMENLPPLLRTLLVTDGTVTKVLEAFFWEPVNVSALELNVRHAEKKIPWLELDVGEEILARKVHLIGQHSGRLFTEAFSAIKLAEFDPSLGEALVQGHVGIGVLLRESGLETYREIMAVGMEYGQEKNSSGINDIWVYRTYRITRGKKPVILIRESFPCRLYDQASS